MLYADVIIPLGVDGLFTYLVPEELVSQVEIGRLVVVPFGKKGWYTGVVYALREAASEDKGIKGITYVIDRDFTLSLSYLHFLEWLSQYYMAPLGVVIKAALPVSMRLESGAYLCFSSDWIAGNINVENLEKEELLVVHGLEEFWGGNDLTKQLIGLDAVYDFMKQRGVVNFSLLYSLIKKGILEIQEHEYRVYRPKLEKVITWNRFFPEGELHALLDDLKRAKAQYALLCNWINYCSENKTSVLERKEFLASVSSSVSALNALCRRGVLKEVVVEVSRFGQVDGNVGNIHALSRVQSEAMERIRCLFKEKACVLLQGVTSSGKTELYLHLIRQLLENKKQVLYLLPEIGLTVQLVRRLRCVFGDQVGVYHSGLSNAQRVEMWQRQNGATPFPIILGVRSSIFLPFKDLGLVIVDEEHDTSYKQQDPAPRYHGRDAAIMLARLHGAKVLLGSATPSFESYQNAMAGKYGFVKLDQRYGGVMSPDVQIIDIQSCRRKGLLKGHITSILHDEIGRELERGKQIILFHNRRGFSTYVQCDNCGSILKCKHCDVSLTYHAYVKQLHCHYCGRIRQVPPVCEKCGKGNYVFTSPPGTEQIEEEIKNLFPKARVARMDTDVMGNKARFQKLMNDFESRNIDVLVGTQMIAKGLDFAGVSLVGIIDAGTLMGFSDFRAEERAYDTLVQVGGRCGRREERGKVIIQAPNINERVFHFVLKEDFHGLFSLLAEERQLFHYPPFYRLILLELRYSRPKELRDMANELVRLYRERSGIQVAGPAEPQVNKINNLFRLQIVIKVEQGKGLSEVKMFLSNTCKLVASRDGWQRIRYFFDVDPL